MKSLSVHCREIGVKEMPGFTVAPLLGLMAALVFFGGLASAQTGEDIDHLSLASMLVGNGHYARAQAELLKVDKEQQRESPLIYSTTSGLIALNAKDYKKAMAAFRSAERVIKAEEDLEDEEKLEQATALKLYLLQCEFGLGEYNAVVARIEKAPSVLRKRLAWSLKAASLWHLGLKSEAWNTLETASEKFALDSSFLMQKVNYLLELDLRREAFSLAKNGVQQMSLTALDYLKVGGLFKKRKRYDQALWFFELGVLAFPSAELLSVELAHTYTLKGWQLAAAQIFEKLALRKPKYYGDVAELYRQKGKLIRSEYFNGLVDDQKKKLRQRFSLALGQKNFSRALSMEPSLSRLGLLEDQNLVYALAFTQFQMGSFSPAKKTLARITDANLFEKVVALRSTIGECESRPWECEE